jgi:hypothetical protein
MFGIKLEIDENSGILHPIDKALANAESDVTIGTCPKLK